MSDEFRRKRKLIKRSNIKRLYGLGTWIRTRINGVRVLYSYQTSIQLHHTPLVQGHPRWDLSSRVSYRPNLSQSRPMKKNDLRLLPMLGQDSKNVNGTKHEPRASRRAGFDHVDAEQRRDQMFPKLRPEAIDRTATAAIERLFFVQKARYCAILSNGSEKKRCSSTQIMAPPRRAD